MGQLVIEVPQNINLKVSVESVAVADEILRLVKKPKKLETLQSDYPLHIDDINSEKVFENSDVVEQKTKSSKVAIIPPRRNSMKEDLEAVFGIWADREESAEEISRRIRDRNNGKDV